MGIHKWIVRNKEFYDTGSGKLICRKSCNCPVLIRNVIKNDGKEHVEYARENAELQNMANLSDNLCFIHSPVIKKEKTGCYKKYRHTKATE